MGKEITRKAKSKVYDGVWKCWRFGACEDSFFDRLQNLDDDCQGVLMLLNFLQGNE